MVRWKCAAPLRVVRQDHPQVEEGGERLAYLEKRVDQMQYPTYQAQGWPIGSGIVESANKVVMQARLKGALALLPRRRDPVRHRDDLAS